jgi:F-type H+-transporting ATPase subunit delta
MAKDHHEFVHRLLALSLDSGVVSPERVGAVLEALRQNPPRHHRQTLKLYARLIRREIARTTLSATYAGQVSPAALEALRKHFSNYYDRPLQLVAQSNPALIAGVRAQIGDDVWDMTASGRLAALAQTTA